MTCPDRLVSAIGNSLTPDLLKPYWRKISEETGNPYAGHCYVAAEAAYHAMRQDDPDWVPCVLTHAIWPDGLLPGETHWFIRHSRTDAIIDPTAAQFDEAVPYELGKGCGFLTSLPSRRARIVLDRVEAALHEYQDSDHSEAQIMTM